VVVAGERLRVSASLYDGRWGSDAAAQAAVEGAPGELFKLVDQLTAQLLAGSARVTPEPMGRLAALTTHSLPALKHFLRGETEFRQGHYMSAFEAFRLATAADSTFALAHYRLAHAANWAVPFGWTWDSLTVRSRIALDHADRLSTRPKLLVQGYHAWLIGEYDEAERAYRAVVQGYPDEVEGWYQLGEVMFHTNPVRGRPILEAGEPFTRVLSLAPEHLGALTHLVRVRAREGRRGALDSLLTRITELSPPERRAEFRVLRAFLLGNESDQARAKAELRSSGNDEMVRATAHRIAVFGGRLDAAAALLELLLDPGLPADVRGHAHLWMADLEVARGRWRAAREHHNAAAALDRATALERRALHEALPFGPGSASHLRAVRDELRAWDAAATPPTRYPWLAPYNGLHAPFREYLLGVVALRLNAAAETQQHAAALDTLNAPAAVRAIGASLGESLRGQIAAADGRDREALARLDRGRLRIGEGLLETELGSQPLERWARAEVLRRQNRVDDAADWYESLPEISIAGLVYLAPVHLRFAQIADARGRSTDAVQHYAEFIELWQHADPELQGTVADARRRFAELRAR
jgi:tetratricopeptide (TPR) repeat protein